MSRSPETTTKLLRTTALPPVNAKGIVRTVQIGVVDLVDLGDRDAKPRVVSVDRTLMSLQPTETFASPAALGAFKHSERVVSKI